MLLQEKMQNQDFSPSEKIVIKFILEKQEAIADYTTTMIAGETYTSPSILIRIAKKLGFTGYTEFLKTYLGEVRYLMQNFQDLDANIPFTDKDSMMTVASKIVQLKTESLQGTYSLIHHDSLQTAIKLIERCDCVKVFTISNLAFQAEEFVYKLRHIGKKAETFTMSNTLIQEAVMTTSSECAVMISYSGETEPLITMCSYLKKNNVPIILLTSIGDNSLSKYADVMLQLTTRERSYSKIGGFTSLESISLILDILYSCFFLTDYQNHLEYKINISKITESRDINNKIISE